MSEFPARPHERLPDPHGWISRIRGKLKPNGSVRRSPYCDILIAMKMQRVPDLKIEQWLIQQGAEFRIPASTLNRNFREVDLKVAIPYGEELAERWGGRIDLDVARELQVQILAQRERVDAMQRAENKRREEGGDDAQFFFLKNLGNERKLLKEMLADLFRMMKSPLEAARERIMADKMDALVDQELDPETEKVLVDLLLAGKLNMTGSGGSDAE